MYRPANYYAARAAAIKEALEEERAHTAAARQPKPVEPPSLYSLSCLLNCGERVTVTLGVFFGDLAGTVVEATYCYAVARHFFLAKYTDDHHAVHFIVVADYCKGDDIYNYAISEEAVL